MRTNFKQLLDAGVHFGHQKRKWNPAMAPYVFMEKNGIHIIDLNKSVAKIEEAASAMKQIVKSGKNILFVATKKQAKDIVAEKVKKINMPYITERWPGGLLTNFVTIRKAVKKMDTIDKMKEDGTIDTLSKRERLQISRTREKLERNLGSISKMNRTPSAIFVVDIHKEKIAVAEAKKLNIPCFAMVDTNSDPNLVEFPIPANDDATNSIECIVEILTSAVAEGLEEKNKADEQKAMENAKKIKAKKEKQEKEARQAKGEASKTEK